MELGFELEPDPDSHFSPLYPALQRKGGFVLGFEGQVGVCGQYLETWRRELGYSVSIVSGFPRTFLVLGLRARFLGKPPS